MQFTAVLRGEGTVNISRMGIPARPHFRIHKNGRAGMPILLSKAPSGPLPQLQLMAATSPPMPWASRQNSLQNLMRGTIDLSVKEGDCGKKCTPTAGSSGNRADIGLLPNGTVV